jgi:hypothetical protein
LGKKKFGDPRNFGGSDPTNELQEYFFNEIWCNDFFKDAVQCIFRPPQDIEKVG